MKWQLVSPVRTFEDEGDYVVFYCAGSGDTHLLDPVASFVVGLLRDGSCSENELLQQLEARLDEVDSEQAEAALLGLLDQLQESEIVEQVEST